jgi:hypothetical protein
VAERQKTFSPQCANPSNIDITICKFVAGEMATDAVTVNVGVMMFGGGRVWLGTPSFEARYGGPANRPGAIETSGALPRGTSRCGGGRAAGAAMLALVV